MTTRQASTSQYVGFAPKIVKVRYKLLSGAKAPFRGSAGASGWDLHCYEPERLYNDRSVMVRTGLFVEIPRGYELQVRPRSGLAAGESITVVNTPGTVDSDFRGEIKVIMIRLGSNPHPYKICAGERIAQAVICPVPEVEWEEVSELSDTERGERGYGSTGK